MNVISLIGGLNRGDEDHHAYVYALCKSSGEVFYIGKGTDARVLAHEIEAKKFVDSLEIPDEKVRIEMTKKIEAIIKENGQPRKIIIKWGMTDQEALMCESALINLHNIRHQGEDALTNRIAGASSDGEKTAGKKSKARWLDEFVQDCGLRTREISDLGDVRVAIININKTYRQCDHDENGIVDVNQIRDCVAGVWRLSKRFNDVKYVFAMFEQRIVGVFRSERVIESFDKENEMNKLSTMPKFPKEIRELDLQMASAADLRDFKRKVPKGVFEKAKRSLQEKIDRNKKRVRPVTVEDKFREFKKRRYFILDDDCPDEILNFKNCIPIWNGESIAKKVLRLVTGNAVLYPEEFK